MTLQIQFVTLGMMSAGGLALGVLFDMYRVLAGQLKVPSWMKAVLDLLYWFIGTLIVFRLLYESNWGEVRPFIFLGLGIGIVLYFLVFSRAVIWVIRLLIRIVLAAVRIGKQLIRVFIVKPAIGLYRFLIIFLGFLLAVAIFLYKTVIQLCYPVWKLLVWLVRPIGRWIRARIPVPAWMKQMITTVAAWLQKFR
ncbi:spore cortex biosynthesis protein YabQ [Paenibacillus naphthalenovorans]|uniref:spore cortex biosynthesis protein YabQ n=1 Tax=Paenibacillus naphthalenovorans TaxID=162209 RepID=UPI0010AFD97B|nr:spore cortex biosynthesis protein YabQ [Paenibacillus naphthalenovorans]GCL74549.1 spore cortex biosynthesis protein YabQ [Paenibacillus naphthalenovorans]